MTYPSNRTETRSRLLTGLAFLAYLAFVVYGSLVPFELRSMSWGQAITGIAHIQYLDLGVASRADWVANIVLYVPLAFLGCAAVLGVRRVGWLAPLGVLLVTAFCLTVAIAVEFTQQWFAPRTVSSNDLIAESIGTLIGILAWGLGRQRIRALQDSVAQGGRASVLAALWAYAVIYMLMSLFPYDFLVSMDELRARLAANPMHWVVATGCGESIRCAARLGVEVLAIAPLGLFAILVWPKVSLKRLFAIGIIVGLVLEPLQLLLASGTSQGLSVVLRGVGLVLGGLAGQQFGRLGPAPVARAMVVATAFLVLPYLAGLALVSGWFAGPAAGIDTALGRLHEVRWLPLYYHYFTTESDAMVSALAQLALYAPVGLGVWALTAGRGERRVGGSWAAVGLALAVAVVIESGKLFFPPNHPDPTNLLIAAIAALAAFGLARWFERVLTGGPFGDAGRKGHNYQDGAAARLAALGIGTVPRPGGVVGPTAERLVVALPVLGAEGYRPVETVGISAGLPTLAPLPSGQGLRNDLALGRSATLDAWGVPLPEVGAILGLPGDRLPQLRPLGACYEVKPSPTERWLLRGLAVVLVLAVVWMLVSYPVAPLALGVVLLSYGAAIVVWPRVWLLVIPAIVPVFDLVPWSGWFYWECVDFFLAVTLVVALTGVWRSSPRMALPGGLLISLLAAIQLLSMLIGLGHLAPIDANAFSSYFSPYNSLRVAKGFIWAVALIPVARATLTDRVAFRHFLLPGLILGFLGVMAALLYERQVFSELLDFTSDFRVTGGFSSMHTGGGHIEAYFSLVLPFVLVFLLEKRTSWVALATVPLLLLAGYGVAVTFARAALIGVAVGLVIVAWGVYASLRKGRSRDGWKVFWLFGLGCVALFAAMLPIVEGAYFLGRIASVERDFATRTSHWKGAVALMTPGPLTALFGMGLGQFPLTYLHAKTYGPLANYRFGQEAKNHFLSLTAGDSLYYEQMVRIQPGQQYRLELDLRTRNPRPRLNVPICAKAMLYSYDCQWLAVEGIRGDGNWHRYQVGFDSGVLGFGPWYSRRPTKLSLYWSAAGDGVDLDNISLRTASGVEVLLNGDFSEANAHWFFSTDNHLPWHIKQLWVAIYFEQGLVGLLVFVLFVGFVLRRLARAVTSGDLIATAFLGGLSGFLAIGLFDSMFDVPRLTLLFFLLCFASLLLPGWERDGRAV